MFSQGQHQQILGYRDILVSLQVPSSPKLYLILQAHKDRQGKIF